jgi:hypothetical protein
MFVLTGDDGTLDLHCHPPIDFASAPPQHEGGNVCSTPSDIGTGSGEAKARHPVRFVFFQ